MGYPIEDKLVVAVASSALFDLSESDRVFREKGEEEYRRYQRMHEHDRLQPGVAFPLVRRLLAMNGSGPDDHHVEVVLLSRNDPDTGLRVFNSIEQHDLAISRGAFTAGGYPFRYMEAFNASLFLSANPDDVKRAVKRGLPAGRVFPTSFVDDHDEPELRLAFDFDGILVDDSAETVFRRDGIVEFLENEDRKAAEPLRQGPLYRFFTEIAKLQQRDSKRARTASTHEARIRVGIFTARNAPAHKRVVTTLRDWGIRVDEALFLGGIEKARFLKEFKPHMFFDDQLGHIEGAAGATPCVHVPFGVANEPTPDEVEQAFRENERLGAPQRRNGV